MLGWGVHASVARVDDSNLGVTRSAIKMGRRQPLSNDKQICLHGLQILARIEEVSPLDAGLFGYQV